MERDRIGESRERGEEGKEESQHRKLAVYRPFTPLPREGTKEARTSPNPVAV